jgi:hypothetical protein
VPSGTFTNPQELGEPLVNTDDQTRIILAVVEILDAYDSCGNTFDGRLDIGPRLRGLMVSVGMDPDAIIAARREDEADSRS